MSEASDRTVHARLEDGAEIVRYDRAGKWCIEYPLGSLKSYRLLSVNEAARLALGGEIFLDLPGGKTFDSRVRAFRKAG